MVEMFGDTRIHVGDIIVIAVYFVLVLFVGLWTSRKNRGSAGGYFLAGRNMHWLPVGASLFASNIGSLHFVGLAGSGAAAGISIANYELNAMFVLILLAYIFLPIYIASGVYTMPQYLQRRFGGKRIQIFLSVLTLLMYIFTKISADLYSGSVFIEQSLNWSMYGAVSLLLGIACIFTITGGLTAVIWTDFFQTILMLAGSSVLMIISFYKVGGFGAMMEKYPKAAPSSLFLSNTTCGKPRQDFMHLFRDPVSSDLPWPGIVGMTVNSIWYWCSDQVIVQRALAARNLSHAKAGTLFCGFLKILPLFLLVFPGMIARILFTDTVGCSDPKVCIDVCGSASGCTNIAYPTLVIQLLPPGARGMMLAVMLAALMSSLTSIFNSSSTIFALDIWTHLRRSASELEIMIVGRTFVVILVIISIIWIPVIKASQGTQLYVYIQEVSSFLQPPICAIFLLGIFWARLNEKGAFFGLMIGFLAGLIRFTIQYSYTSPACGSTDPDPTPDIIKNFHYLYFSIFLFLLTILSSVIISHLTKPIPRQCLLRLTWMTRHSREPRQNIQDWMREQQITDLSTQKTDLSTQITDLTTQKTDLSTQKTDLSTQKTDLTHQKYTDLEQECGSKEEHCVTNDQDIHKQNVISKEDIHRQSDMNNTEKMSALSDLKSNTRCMQPPCFIFTSVFNWICGLDSSSKLQLSRKHLQEDDLISIEESRASRRLTVVMSVTLAASAIFINAFFA